MKNLKSKNNKEYWKAHVKAYHKSGLSQKEYCKQNNISYWSFNPWKRRLDREDRELQEISPEIVETLAVDNEQVEIIINDTIKVSVPSRFSEEALRKVLLVLGAVK